MKKLIAGLLFFASTLVFAQTFPVQNLNVLGTANFAGQAAFTIPPVMGGAPFYPTAATNATLKSLSTVTTSTVVRLGFLTSGDVAPVTYTASGSACSLNGGQGDNGYQVSSANGLCWIANFGKGPVNLKEWGAQGDNVTNDQPALQSALNYASNGGPQLIVPPGKYLIPSAVTSAGALTVTGTGMSASALIFSGNANWQHSGGAITPAPGNNQFTLKAISLRTSDLQNASTALLDVVFPSGGNGDTIRAVTIEDVEVCGVTLSNGFNGGIHLFNATTLKVNRVRIANRNTDVGNFLPGSFGISVDTDSQAGDWYIDQTNIYFCNSGILAIGEGTGQGFEGLTVTNSLMVANNVGVNVQSSVVHLYVRLSGNNINSVAVGILVQNMVWVSLTDNILYAYDNGITVANWIGISFVETDVAHGIPALNVVSGNQITALTTTHATSTNGIVFGANSHTTETNTVIDGNTFSNLNAGIVMFSGTNNLRILDTNTFNSNIATPVSDSSGNASNIIAFATLGNPGAFRNNLGVEQKWAASVSVVLTAGVGSVTFPSAFKTACDSVVVINGNPGGSFSGNVVNVVDSSIGAGGFGIQVGGATTGTIVINYIAMGH